MDALEAFRGRRSATIPVFGSTHRVYVTQGVLATLRATIMTVVVVVVVLALVVLVVLFVLLVLVVVAVVVTVSESSQHSRLCTVAAVV